MNLFLRFRRFQFKIMQISRERFFFANMFLKFINVENVIESRMKKFAVEIFFYESCILFSFVFLIFIASIKYFRFMKKKFEDIISFSKLDLNELKKSFS